MSFLPKVWFDDERTELTAESMVDLEQRLADYVDSKTRDPGRPGLQFFVENPEEEHILEQEDRSATIPDLVAFELAAPRLVQFAMLINCWHPGFGQDMIPTVMLDDVAVENERGNLLAGELGSAIESGALLKTWPIENGTVILVGGTGGTPDWGKVFSAWVPAGAHTVEIKYRSTGGGGGYISQRQLAVIL